MSTSRQISAMFLGAALALGTAPLWSQQSTPGTSARQDMRNAGHETSNATKDAASGTKKGTQHAYNKTKSGTKTAANKTKNTTKGAVDGAKAGAQQPPR